MDDTGSDSGRRIAWPRVLIAAATASAGAYYAFFACALLLLAGCYGWVATGTWRALASAGLVVAVIVAAGVANHAPTFPYQYHFGHNSTPTARVPEEAEEYGLKMTHLFLPVAEHHSRALATLRSIHDSDIRQLQTENTDATLGVVGSAGLLVLLAVALLPVRRAWLLGPLSGLAVFAVLLGTIGGLGALFNLLVTPQVRCYNRISVFVAFLGLTAACWLIDRVFASRTGWATTTALAGVPRAGRVRRLGPDRSSVVHPGIRRGPGGGGRTIPGRRRVLRRGRADDARRVGVRPAVHRLPGNAGRRQSVGLRPRPRIPAHRHPALELRRDGGSGGRPVATRRVVRAAGEDAPPTRRARVRRARSSTAAATRRPRPTP